MLIPKDYKVNGSSTMLVHERDYGKFTVWISYGRSSHENGTRVECYNFAVRVIGHSAVLDAQIYPAAETEFALAKQYARLDSDQTDFWRLFIAALAHENPERFAWAFVDLYTRGQRNGREALQDELRNMLGISRSSLGS